MDKQVKTMRNKTSLIKKKHLTFDQDALNAMSHEEIDVQLTLLENAFDIYKVSYEAVTCEADDKDQDTYVDQMEELSNIYAKTKSRFKTAMRNDSVNITVQPIKLPSINIPSFNGNIDECCAFKDKYESLIHKNKSLDEAHRIHYLKSCLSGAAAEIVSSIPSSGEYYEEAWSLLTNRYDNKRLIVQTHMHKLFNQPAIQQESAGMLKTLLDVTNKHVSALKVLKLPVEHWDTIIVHVVSSRLPTEVKRSWEIETSTLYDLPTWPTLQEFIASRIHALDMLEFDKPNTVKDKPASRTFTHTAIEHKNNKCQICNKTHSIYQCDTFMKASVDERRLLVSKSKLCWNCLRTGHLRSQCPMDKGCKTCGYKHHTLLHTGSEESKPTAKTETIAVDSPVNTVETVAAHGRLRSTTLSSVLLSTALVRVHGRNGRTELYRALLDSASQSHFITSALVTKLGLPRTSCSVTVEGIASASSNMSHMTSVKVSSRVADSNYLLSAIVTPRVTMDLPTTRFDISNWSHFDDVVLADPNFNVPGRIDLLIGAEVFMDSITDGKRRGPVNTSALQNSTFGWIVHGTNTTSTEHTHHVLTHCSTLTLDNTLKKFWELEEVPRIPNMSSEDQACDEHFKTTHAREESGRYVLRLPLKKAVPEENNSYWLASQRLLKVERLLSKQPDIARQYREFMLDYEQAGHMEKVNPQDEHQPLVFIPHHHICRPSSTTTKLRVVFDGSCVMNTGQSLNEYLHKGEKLQRDIVSSLISDSRDMFLVRISSRCSDKSLYIQLIGSISVSYGEPTHQIPFNNIDLTPLLTGLSHHLIKLYEHYVN